jgi:hypothetical protein
MYQVETNEQGKQLIERLPSQNAKLLYSYGFECGVMNLQPIDFVNGVVKMPSVSVQIDTEGNIIGNPTRERGFDVNVKLTDCIDDSGNLSIVGLKDLYIEAVLLRQTPVPVEPLI